MKYVKDKTFFRDKVEQELSFVDLRRMKSSMKKKKKKNIKTKEVEYREDKHGVMKRYRSLQAGLFHLVMVFFSAYFGVININWVNLDLDSARLGLAIGDDFSIWIRVSAIALGIICVIMK